MTVLTNVRIWDGVAGDVDAGIDAIRFEAGRVVAIGTTGEMAGEDCVDLGGATVIPGLIDAHVHLCLDPDERDPLAHGKRADDDLLAQMSERALAMARAGITTARDLGGGRWLELEIRDRIARGAISGPRLLCAGQPVTSPGGHCHFWGGEAATLEDALEVLERQVEKGSDLIKVMATGGALTPNSRPVDSQFDGEVLAAIAEAARKTGRHVAAHCHGTGGIYSAAVSGIATIEHCSWVGESGWGTDFDEAVARVIAERGVYVSPTVNLGWKRRDAKWASRMKKNFSAMKAVGVRFIASTDAGIPGVYHPDLPKALGVFASYADLSPVEVLRSATSVSATAMGLGEVTGRIAPGFAADLVIVDGDPLIDLDCLAEPVEVVSGGRSLYGIAAPVGEG